MMNQALAELEGTGEGVSDEVLAAISLYLPQCVNRLGRYRLNPKRKPAVLDYGTLIRTIPMQKKREGSLGVA
jgi:hypothetical protein